MATTLLYPPAPGDTTAWEPPRTQPDPLGLELRQPAYDRWVAILPNPTPGQARFKLQYFTSSGLAGHQPYASPQAARRAALRHGFTVPDPGALKHLSQTPAWQATYDTPPAPAPALRRVLTALALLQRQGVTVDTITIRPGAVPPRIVISGPPPASPALSWQCYAWGQDRRGRYRRLAASLEGCQVVREVRDGPPRPHSRR